MAQHDYVIANGTGAAVRSDLNNALAAIVSQNSGATEPATTYAFQFWADTTTGLLKLRNSSNNAWVTLFQLDGEWSTLPVENGTAAAPSIYFKDSGTDTGFYSPGTDQVAISTAGTGRLFINSSGSVGIGTNSPSTPLHVLGITTIANASSYGQINLDGAAASNDYGRINFQENGTVRSYITDNALATAWQITQNKPLTIATNNTERVRITGAGNVGIGNTNPQRKLVVSEGGAQGFEFFPGDGGGGNTLNHYNRSTASFVNSTTNANQHIWGRDDGEKARIDTSGRLLVGTSSTYTDVIAGGGGYSGPLWIASTGTANCGQFISSWSSDAAVDPYGASIVLSRSKNGTIGSHTALASGNAIGTISFNGSDGSKFVSGAVIKAEIDGGVSTSDLPSRLVFSTTADGASSPTERARITNAGYFKATSTGDYFSSTATNHELRTGSNGDWTSIFTHTHGSNPFGIRVYYPGAAPNGTANGFFVGEDSSAVRVVFRSNGGLANYQANNVNLSDINTKKDISPAAGTWDCIKEWEIVNYRYKDQPDDADLNLGVIAQQVAESCPEVITIYQEAKEATEDQPAQEERLGIKEQQMYWMAIKALQEAQVRIEQLEAKVAALESA